ncbi:hypothetical protein P9239_21795 [Caballeronia sp. LZ062]|uniref:hypothetical protein n=1 Tax=unclassified Caballeronia TaxID=2646786 RepID=UPI00285BB8DF|nr:MULTISPECIES: hypothetical protein [unclassified Caballeronia]MDR5856315.1 hypothetical protein [Caballeronia sp. LZ050]MDR5872985.1 hypothetical protein [Caballeronia sp. LZ062]
MSEAKITINPDGHPVVEHAVTIEKRSTDVARAVAALSDVLASGDGAGVGQPVLIELLRTLAHEQLALTEALSDYTGEVSLEEAYRRTYRRAFRKGFTAGLQRTLPARPVDRHDSALATPAAAAGTSRNDALRRLKQI